MAARDPRQRIIGRIALSSVLLIAGGAAPAAARWKAGAASAPITSKGPVRMLAVDGCVPDVPDEQSLLEDVFRARRPAWDEPKAGVG